MAGDLLWRTVLHLNPANKNGQTSGPPKKISITRQNKLGKWVPIEWINPTTLRLFFRVCIVGICWKDSSFLFSTYPACKSQMSRVSFFFSTTSGSEVPTKTPRIENYIKSSLSKTKGKVVKCRLSGNDFGSFHGCFFSGNVGCKDPFFFFAKRTCYWTDLSYFLHFSFSFFASWCKDPDFHATAGSLNDLILGMHVSPIVDGRNPKQPPGMYKTLYKNVTRQPPGMYKTL